MLIVASVGCHSETNTEYSSKDFVPDNNGILTLNSTVNNTPLSFTIVDTVRTKDGNVFNILSISDFAGDGSGGAFVVDNFDHSVYHINNSNIVDVVLDGRGRGPYDFIDPVFVGYDTDSRRLFIYDTQLGIKSYIYDNVGLMYDYKISTTYHVNGICVLGNRLLVHGYSIVKNSNEFNSLLHSYDLHGQYLESEWEAVSPSDNPIINEIGNSGTIRCNPTLGEIVFIETDGGILSFYDVAIREITKTIQIDNIRYRSFHSIKVDGAIGGRFEKVLNHNINKYIGDVNGTYFILYILKTSKRGEVRPSDAGQHAYSVTWENTSNILYEGHDIGWILGHDNNNIYVAEYSDESYILVKRYNSR